MKYELQGFLKPLIAVANRRVAIFSALLITTLACLGVLRAGSASAQDTSMLCSGYSGCSINGFTTNGYQNAEDQMWWRMYAGDNCTNYAAYVESHVYGVSTPDYLLGDGGQWGYNAAAHGVPVNATPAVGSVAVWDEGSAGMGGYGHVAVVERIGPGGSYVDVSQSGMGDSDDGFDWERVYRSGGSWEPWPSSFIHFSGSRMPGTVPAGDQLPAGLSRVRKVDYWHTLRAAPLHS